MPIQSPQEEARADRNFAPKHALGYDHQMRAEPGDAHFRNRRQQLTRRAVGGAAPYRNEKFTAFTRPDAAATMRSKAEIDSFVSVVGFPIRKQQWRTLDRVPIDPDPGDSLL